MNNKILTIAVDLDGVLHDTFKSVMDLTNNIFNEEIKYEDLTWASDYPVKEEEVELRKKFDTIWQEEGELLYREKYLNKRLIDLINLWSIQGHEVILYSTNNNHHEVRNKLDFLSVIKEEKLITDIHILFSMNTKPAIKADIVIEDLYENLSKYGEDTRKILIQRPWNKKHWNAEDIELATEDMRINGELLEIEKFPREFSEISI